MRVISNLSASARCFNFGAQEGLRQLNLEDSAHDSLLLHHRIFTSESAYFPHPWSLEAQSIHQPYRLRGQIYNGTARARSIDSSADRPAFGWLDVICPIITKIMCSRREPIFSWKVTCESLATKSLILSFWSSRQKILSIFQASSKNFLFPRMTFFQVFSIFKITNWNEVWFLDFLQDHGLQSSVDEFPLVTPKLF